jgi:hypothetical protein
MMGKDNPGQVPQPSPPGESTGRRWRGRRSPAFQLAALVLVVLSCSACGFLMLKFLQSPQGSPGGSGTSTPSLFHLWPKDRAPDLALVLTGETYSYLQPCGCSPVQHGGLARRYNFLQGLINDRHWPVVALDLGDVAQHNGPQTLLKYTVMMKALHKMGYTAVGIGRHEMALPLIDALSEYTLNNPFPRVLAANLLKKEENFPEMVRSWEIAAPHGAPRVDVVGAVDQSVARQVNDPTIRFAGVATTLPETVKDMEAKKRAALKDEAAKPDVRVLLLQGTVEEAKKCAAQFPQFHVILCLSAEPDPPDQPDRVGKTLIVTVGHKGRYLGVVGVFRTSKPDNPFELFYQLVLLAPDYETPAGQEATNPIHAMLEEYTQDVKAGNYLGGYPKSPHPIQVEFKGATYVGSEACKKCHKREYEIWKASPHARAYQTLTQAKRPALRQFDGECVICHTTGFDHADGFTGAQTTPHLLDNGCENCHGPGSLHVAEAKKGTLNPKLLALMNPYKTQPNETEAQKTLRINRLDLSCQKCHDIDNDTHWTIKKWVEGKIAH